MLTGISAKWIPFLLFTLIQGYVAQRFLSEETCQSLLQGQTIQFRGGHKEVDELELLVERFNQLLGPLGVERIKIYAVREHAANRSFLFNRRLFVGTQELNSNFEKTRTIFIHELAHAAFEGHFKVRLGSEVISMHEFYQRHLRSPTPELEIIARNVHCYNELFADIVAVLFSEDAEVIPRAHGFPSAIELGLVNETLPEDLLTAAKYRGLDFTVAMNFHTWEKLMKDLSTDRTFEFQRRYKLLAPSRGVIWRLYLRDLKPDQIVGFLQAFLAASSEHLAMTIAQPELSDSALEMNQSFLRVLVRTIKDAAIAH